MMDSGIVSIYALTNTAVPGDMPKYGLTLKSRQYYEERVIGYGRQYEAKGVNERVDLIARIWRSPVRIGDFAIIEDSPDSGQYRIDNVQNLLDDDGLQVTDLTLYRVDELYDIIG